MLTLGTIKADARRWVGHSAVHPDMVGLYGAGQEPRVSRWGPGEWVAAVLASLPPLGEWQPARRRF